MKCIACGSEKIKFYFKKNGFDMMRCEECSLLFVGNIPDDLSKYYSEGYFTGDAELEGYMDYDFEKEMARKSYLKYLKQIKKYISGSDIFEIGCATGFFMKLAKESGMSVSGIDISEYAVGKAREKGLDVTCRSIDDLSDDECKNNFDAVVMLDVVEHVKKPQEVFNKSSKMLKEKGLVVFLTPDSGSLWARLWRSKWHAFVPPQHLHYFSEKNIKSLLEKNKFRALCVKHYGKSFTLPYIFRLLYSWTGFGVWRILANFSSRNFLKNISVPINLFDTMFVIAKKYE